MRRRPSPSPPRRPSRPHGGRLLVETAALRQRLGRRLGAFLAACDDAPAAQRAALRRLVAINGRTALARRLGADRASTPEELRRRVPLTTWDSLQPERGATLAGEPDAMVAGRARAFAISAGTTGRSKEIPMTPASLRAFTRGAEVFFAGVARDHPRALARRPLFLSWTVEQERAPAGAPMLSVTGLGLNAAPGVMRRASAAPPEAFAFQDPRARAYATALCALQHEVSLVGSPTVPSLLLLGETMRDQADALLRDLREGAFRPPAPALPHERAALQRWLSPQPARAAALARRASAAGALTPAAAWPDLRLLVSWFSGGCGAGASELPALYPALPRRDAPYASSEGCHAVPLEDGGAGGALAVAEAIFEFIPLDAGGERAGDPLWAWEVEPGARYSLVASTPSGLWRYVLGDVVECTGRVGSAPRIRFVEREGHALTLVHDRTTEHHLRAAVQALRDRGVEVLRFCLGPAAGSTRPPRYALAVACAGPPPPPDEAAGWFDAALRAANFSYHYDRREGAIGPAELHVVPAERFRALDAQRKPLELSRSPDFLRALGVAPVDGDAESAGVSRSLDDLRSPGAAPAGGDGEAAGLPRSPELLRPRGGT